MEVTAVFFTLAMLVFILPEKTFQSHNQTNQNDAFLLRITPDRMQHFEYESVSFLCESIDNSTQLKGIRNSKEFVPLCNSKRLLTGLSCTIDKTYQGDSGEYWCETNEGEKSNTVNITVTGGSVILESPALPVIEGESVTLGCSRKTNSTNLAVFYKNDVFLQVTAEDTMIINNFSKSDEGIYKCSFSDVGTSPGSWLVLTGNITFFTFTPPYEDSIYDDSNSPSVLDLLRFAFTIFMAVVVLLLGMSRLKILALKMWRACH
ncbi:low affinity immunoglobulin gamma Fc region receptor II-b-like isoform X2 [Anabas testudineus]|uniref:Ig-like domain-containing protein n=1 Tax=Anabas testudineus TaxID=64144 RepID=A0A3Q1H5A2_ANATE|nr:low affinity immunoglobulin gamma Fc region receptor II-b-like isoform X2 [Anabas testudineus]